MTITIENIQCHRNSISGAPFHASLFLDPDQALRAAIIEAEEGMAAV